jgi:hypothetical protein
MSNSRNDLDFIRDMLIMALSEKRDDIVGDLFKMYEQVQNRPTIPTGNINIDSFTKPDGTEYNFTLSSEFLSEMGDVTIGNFNPSSAALNNDVISFG